MKAMVRTPLCPLYVEPEDAAPLADEALCGMVVEVTDRAQGWRRVETHYRYTGWARADCLLEGEEAAERWMALPRRTVLNKTACDVLPARRVDAPPALTLPLGAWAAPAGEPEDGWQRVLLCGGEEGWVRAGVLGPLYTAPPFREEARLRALIVQNAMRYENTQYRWGGKTPWGVDCSGLASMAYLLSGIVIYRDALLKDGFPLRPIPLTAAGPGDLLFFDGHVAVYTGGGSYVHATLRAGSDGFTRNSLDPASPCYRPDLARGLRQVGSYFA